MKIYFNQIIRSVFKNKLNSIIMIVGLAVAFSIFLVIFTYTNQEFNYNSFYKDKDQIFRVNYQAKYANGQQESAVYLDRRVAEVIKDKIPQIQHATALRTAHQPLLRFEGQNFEEDLKIVHPGFFQIFGFPVLFGGKNDLFLSPDEIAVTASLAGKLCAVKSCRMGELIGQPVFFDKTGDTPFTISAILKDVPKNSSIQFSALIPFDYETNFNQSNNLFGNASVFYKIKDGEDREFVSKLVGETITELYGDFVRKKIDQEILLDSKEAFIPHVSSLADVYLGNISSDNERSNNKNSLYVLLAVGILLLITATCNFILLSVGQSARNIEQINLRKAMGAGSVHIFIMYFAEHFFITSIACFIGLIMAVFFFSEFNQLAATELYLGTINFQATLLTGISGAALIAFLASILLVVKTGRLWRSSVSHRPAAEGKTKSMGAFVTLQYGLSLFLIILTLFIVRQTHYMRDKDLGFSSENMLNLSTYNLTNGEKLALKNRLLPHAGIDGITLTNRNYISGRSSENIQNEAGENFTVRTLQVDHNYVSTLDLKVTDGRDFAKEATEKQAVLINEKLAKLVFAAENPIGRTIKMYGVNYQVIGIIKDFHYDSTKEEIQPLILISGTETGDKGNFMLLRYNPAQLSTLIPFLKDTWNKVAPQKVMEINFWDQQLNQRYGTEERWSKIIGYAALIAIIISTLGLFGLTVSIINKRTKEIGIRKVNGARISEILTMLNRDFVKWVAIAFVIATPVAWYAMHKWLENFAYKTTLSWWIFALAGLLALGIALLTVSWQSWKAATRNPVEALRYE